MKTLLSPETLWNHWEGHRRLTLRALEAFPEDQLGAHPVANMRSFAELMAELIDVEESVMKGLNTGAWKWEPTPHEFRTKADIANAFAAIRPTTEAIFSSMSPEKFASIETDAWGVTSSNLERLWYVIDNEIHHRGQVYVYLRMLGIEPPAFYVR